MILMMVIYFIDGTSIRDIKRSNVHDLFTMVLQDTWLFNGTVKENIIYNQKHVSDKKVEEVCKIVALIILLRLYLMVMIVLYLIMIRYLLVKDSFLLLLEV